MNVAQTIIDLAKLHDDLVDLALRTTSIEIEPVVYLIEGAEADNVFALHSLL